MNIWTCNVFNRKFTLGRGHFRAFIQAEYFKKDTSTIARASKTVAGRAVAACRIYEKIRRQWPLLCCTLHVWECSTGCLVLILSTAHYSLCRWSYDYKRQSSKIQKNIFCMTATFFSKQSKVIHFIRKFKFLKSKWKLVISNKVV